VGRGTSRRSIVHHKLFGRRSTLLERLMGCEMTLRLDSVEKAALHHWLKALAWIEKVTTQSIDRRGIRGL
jgi:hypothetical protein